MKNIAIFASGEGTNAQNIINYFKKSDSIKVALIVSNKLTAPVVRRAKNEGIPTLVIDRKSFYESEQTIEQLKNAAIDFIILAGFLWLIPKNLVKEFPNKIINIHPALLPKFGGKGMYGSNVHKAVIDAHEKQSGISIHFVNEHFDEGELIAQFTCDITLSDTPETLAKKIHDLEYEYFPKTIETTILKIK